jgi:hypothetical protein
MYCSSVQSSCISNGGATSSSIDLQVLAGPVVPERDPVMVPDELIDLGGDTAVRIGEDREHAARLQHAPGLPAERIDVEPMQRLADRDELRRTVGQLRLVLGDTIRDPGVPLRETDLVGTGVGRHHAGEPRDEPGRDLPVPRPGVPRECRPGRDDGEPVEERRRIARPEVRVGRGVRREVVGERAGGTLGHGFGASSATNAIRSPRGLSASREIPFTPSSAKSASTSHRSPTRTRIRVPDAVISWPAGVHRW